MRPHRDGCRVLRVLPQPLEVKHLIHVYIQFVADLIPRSDCSKGVDLITRLNFGTVYLIICRHRKRAREYESAVDCNLEAEQGNLKVMQRSQSLRKALPVFQAAKSFRKDDSSIYYIYTNPLPVGRHDEDDDVEATHTTLTVNDPKSSIILDPPIFYLQL